MEAVSRDAFTAAIHYQNEWDRYRSLSATARRRTMPPRRDLELDALVEILEGQRLVHSHSYRQDEILMLIRLAEEYGFTIGTFQHVLEGYQVADAIPAHAAGASPFTDWRACPARGGARRHATTHTPARATARADTSRSRPAWQAMGGVPPVVERRPHPGAQIFLTPSRRGCIPQNKSQLLRRRESRPVAVGIQERRAARENRADDRL